MEKTMLDYIRETPDVLNEIIDNSSVYAKELVDHYVKEGYEGICLIASGSSNNGCLCARSFMQHILDMEIDIHAPFTFIHHEIDHIHNKMCIAVSQSGCSTNTLDALRALKEKGHKTCCLVGRDDCDAKQIADLTVNWHVGEETVGFVTKGVASLACFLMCFSIELAKALGKNMEEVRYQKMICKLKEAVDLHPEMVEEAFRIFGLHKEDFISRGKVILLSSGPNYGTACEAALKIAETSCIVAQAFEAEEFLHGPLYPSVPEDLFLIIDNNDDASSARMIDIAHALKDVSGKVYVISNDPSFDDDHAFRTTKETCMYRSPLYKLACLQTLAYLMTMETNHYEPHEAIKNFKKANKVSSKSRANLYQNLQNL
ncbi:MAG: SIS domain-containing protein [Erysipelotrichaceae bacterium]|nr:SIS domain-containing protein [Erysipelotrichaceae bacterium]